MALRIRPRALVLWEQFDQAAAFALKQSVFLRWMMRMPTKTYTRWLDSKVCNIYTRETCRVRELPQWRQS